VSCVVLVIRSFNHTQPPVIHVGAAEVVLLSPRSPTQRWHSHALRPPQTSLWTFQSFTWHSGVQ